MALVAVLLLSAGLAVFASAHAAAQEGRFEDEIERFADDPSPLDLSPSALDPTRDLVSRQRPAEPTTAAATETAKPITHFPAQAAVVGGVFGVMVVGLMAMLLRRRR